MPHPKIETSLFEKISQGGTHSVAKWPVYITASNHGCNLAHYPECKPVGELPLLYGELNSGALRQLADSNDVAFIWDAEKLLSIAPLETTAAMERTDIRSIVFNPQDVDFPHDGDQLNGQGMKCAIIDTSVDINHPDISSCIVKTTDCTDDDNFLLGDQFHGTHVAGIVNHIAPQASLLLNKAFNKNNQATRKFIVDAIIVAVADGADVINGSWGESFCEGDCPIDIAVSYAVEQGVIFVSSAGNEGPGTGTLTCPAGNLEALTIAACTCDEEISDFSSRGPSYKDGSAKPDITAPGQDISSCAPGGGYICFSGTSMSAPVVTGACALIKQEILEAGSKEHFSPLEVKETMMDTAKKLGYKQDEEGAGLLHLGRAIQAARSGKRSFFNFKRLQITPGHLALFAIIAFCIWYVHDSRTPQSPPLQMHNAVAATVPIESFSTVQIQSPAPVTEQTQGKVIELSEQQQDPPVATGKPQFTREEHDQMFAKLHRVLDDIDKLINKGY